MNGDMQNIDIWLNFTHFVRNKMDLFYFQNRQILRF